MNDKRGFHFLVGLATLWLGLRLLQAGILHDIGFLATGQPAMKGPGAILVAVFVEGVIAVGTVAVLIFTGLWDLVMVSGKLIGDMSRAAHAYLYAAAKDRIAKQKPAKADTPKTEPVTPAQPLPKTEGEALLLTIADTRKRADENAAAIGTVLEKLDAIAGQIETKPTAKRTTRTKAGA